jgi:drug/metabolite transporter (DMT)-like permease
MQNQTKAYLFAMAAVFLWSTVGTAFKLALEHVDFINLLFYASLISVIIFSIIISLQNKWRLMAHLSVKDVLRSAMNGFLNPFLYYYILFQAYDILLAQEALTLNYLWPIVLVLLSIPLLKQKIGLISIIAVFISFTGSYIIATGGNVLGMKFTNTYGVLLALISTLIWALFWILNVKDKREEVTKMFLNFCFGFIYTAIVLFITGKLIIPDIYGLTGVAYVGLFEMGITFIFWLKALKFSVTTAKVSNLIFIAPFLSLLFINIILGEHIKPATFIGLLFIICGILTEQYFASRRKYLK